MTIRARERTSAAVPPALRSPGLRALRRFRPNLTLRRTSIMLGAAGIMLIALGTAFIAWNERRVLFQEGRDHADQSASYLADHAQRLFEVSDIVLHTTDTAIGPRPLDASGVAPEVIAGMARAAAMLPYVDTVFAADAAGIVRATTLDNALANYSVADRSVFKQAQRVTDDRLLIGEAITGHVSGRSTFLVARRRPASDGSFAGIVGAAMTLSYFTEYWRSLDKRNDEQIALVRLGSGNILVRYPTGPDDADLGASVAAAAAAGTASGTFAAGPHGFGTYRRVGTLPVAIAVVFRDAVIEQQWEGSLRRLLPLSGGMMLLLLAVMALARRLARREDVARREIETARALLSATNARLEQRVAERTADLLESNREVQRFAYIVSHDLRAPLVNIMGFTAELQGLRDEVLGHPDGFDEAARQRLRADFDEAFGFIRSSIDKMDRLIKAILALSRQGQRVLSPELLDMDALMRSVADGVAHRAQQAGATITLHPLPALIGDRIAVEQVFANLVDNAIKYLRPGVPGTIEVGGTASASTVSITVRDNGRGIDPNDRERVFELFRRAGRQDQPGDGIGLATVRSLIRRLQGTITLDSAAGSGSVFTVTLPRTGSASGADG